MDVPIVTHALQSQSQEKRLDPDFHIVIVFCLIGLLLTLCGLLVFPEIGTVLGQFTLS
jgi:hypothetical protein